MLWRLPFAQMPGKYTSWVSAFVRPKACLQYSLWNIVNSFSGNKMGFVKTRCFCSRISEHCLCFILKLKTGKYIKFNTRRVASAVSCSCSSILFSLFPSFYEVFLSYSSLFLIQGTCQTWEKSMFPQAPTLLALKLASGVQMKHKTELSMLETA